MFSPHLVCINQPITLSLHIFNYVYILLNRVCSTFGFCYCTQLLLFKLCFCSLHLFFCYFPRTFTNTFNCFNSLRYNSISNPIWRQIPVVLPPPHMELCFLQVQLCILCTLYIIRYTLYITHHIVFNAHFTTFSTSMPSYYPTNCPPTVFSTYVVVNLPFAFCLFLNLIYIDFLFVCSCWDTCCSYTIQNTV